MHNIWQCGTVHIVPHTLFVSAGLCFRASLGLKTLPLGTAHCNHAGFMAANLPFTEDQDWWRLSWLTGTQREMPLSNMHHTLIKLSPSGRRQTRKCLHKFLVAWEIWMLDKWRRKKNGVPLSAWMITLVVFNSNTWDLLHLHISFSGVALLTHWPDYLH